MTTLENLYYGNIAPHEYEVVRGSEYDITAKLVIHHEQELSAMLTERQNAILQKIKDNHTELMNLGERDGMLPLRETVKKENTETQEGSISMSKKSNVSAEKKLEIVMQCLRKEVSIRAASEEIHVDDSAIADWIRIYELEGVSAFCEEKKNKVYSLEIKTQAVLAYLKGEGSLQQICKKFKILYPSSLRHWIKVYNSNGNLDSVKRCEGGSYMNKGRKVSYEERVAIAKDCIANDKNYSLVAKKYNVSYQMARKWTLKFEELGESGLEDRRGQRKKDQEPRSELEEAQIEIEKLKHQLYLSEMENTLLKKLQEIERRDVYRK